MLKYKFKHLEKHHLKELNAKIYRATRNYETIGELCETIDTIIDIYVANGSDTSQEKALHKHIVSGSFLPKCTRVEVIDQSGRAYVNWKPTNKVKTMMQDDNKTLKVFIS